MRSEKLFLVLARIKPRRANALVLALCNMCVFNSRAEPIDDVSWGIVYVERRY